MLIVVYLLLCFWYAAVRRRKDYYIKKGWVFMKKNLFTKALSLLLGTGLVSGMLPVAAASAEEVIRTTVSEPAPIAETAATTSEAYIPTTTTAPAQTTAPAVTTAPVGTTAPVMTTTAVETNFTGTYTGTTVVTAAQTVLRTTRTRLPDEGIVNCGVNAFMDGAYIGFGQTLENVYMVNIEYPEEIASSAYEAGMRFNLEYDGQLYQVVYPLSIISYNSKEGSYSSVCIVNDFSYAAVRYGDIETTVSALDTVDFQLCDKLYEAMTACDGAELEVVPRTPSYSGTTVSTTTSGTSQTTTAPYDGNYVYVGGSVTIPVYYEELPADIESVTRDNDGTIIEITETERMSELINIHILGVSEGESLIIITCTDGSVVNIPVAVFPAETTTSSASGSTTTASTLPNDSNTTSAPVHSTTYSFTTTPEFIAYPKVGIDKEIIIEGEYYVPVGNDSEPAVEVEIMQDGMLEVVSAEALQENGTGKYIVKLLGTSAGTSEVRVTVCDQKFLYLVTVIVETDGFLYYDVNADGVVDISDATLVLSIYSMKAAGLAMDEYPDWQILRADANDDGVINLQDATDILSYYAENAVK